MRGPRQIVLLAGVLALAALLGACASPITHPVALTYTGQAKPPAASAKTVGIQTFEDRRDRDDRFLIGYRSLGRGEWERYVSSGRGGSRDGWKAGITHLTRCWR